MTSQKLSFPLQHARTQRFTLGAPRAFTVSPDGTRVIFLRSASGSDRTNRLLVLDTGTGEERVAADPDALLGGSAEALSPQEKARRERVREGSVGIVGYAVDDAVELAAFALSGRAYVAELRAGDGTRPAGARSGDRPAPLARRAVRRLRLAGSVAGRGGGGRRGPPGRGAGGRPRVLRRRGVRRGGGDEPLPRFLVVAGLGPPAGRPRRRQRRTAVVDRRSRASREAKPAEVGYPAAGTANAEVRLFVTDLEGARTEVAWDRSRFPYLARVHWSSNGAPLLLVQARDQRSQLYLAVDTESGATRTVHVDEDEIWLDLFAGVPAWAPDGRLVRIADEGARGCSRSATAR